MLWKTLKDLKFFQRKNGRRRERTDEDVEGESSEKSTQYGSLIAYEGVPNPRNIPFQDKMII